MGRLSRDRSRKPTSVSRTIPVYGDPDRGCGLDAGVWYECWFCGQKNNSDKSKLGDGDSTDGVVYVDYSDNPDYGETYGIAVLGGIENSYTAQINDSNGNPSPVKNSIIPSDSGTGCSFCGSLNWRGDYP